MGDYFPCIVAAGHQSDFLGHLEVSLTVLTTVGHETPHFTVEINMKCPNLKAGSP